MSAPVRLFFYFALYLAFSNDCLANEKPEILLEQTQASWHVTYHTKVAVDKIEFVRNPDNKRTKRWLPDNNAFEVIYANKKEFIKRKDNTPFKQVTLKLTPNYTRLAKDYAPFVSASTLKKLQQLVNEKIDEPLSFINQLEDS